MNPSGLVGLIFVIVFGALIVILGLTSRSRPGRRLREISAFSRLRRAVGLAVESGTRLHISLGWARLTDSNSAAALVGLAMLGRIARAASISDRPPVATAGSGDMAILARDTLRGAYRSLGAESQYDPTAGRLVGLTPFSYAVGTIPVMHDENISANVLVGHVDGEAALIADAAERSGSLTIAGTDSVPGQAVLYAAAEEPLIGEEVFAGGAYLGAGTAHEASLRVQDIFRWIVIGFILVGAVFSFLGLDQVIANLLTGAMP